MTPYIILEAAILASSLSLDTFTAGFAYGSSKTRIPVGSVLVINLISSGITGLALTAGELLKPYLPHGITLALSFAVLLIIGLSKLLDSITKSIIRKHSNISKELKISLFNFRFVLSLYANPEAADIDASQSISPTEAAILALSLSLDGIAVGFGAALANVSAPAVFLWSLVTNAAFLMLGHFIGGKISEKAPARLTWLSGAVLIALAISKLF